MRRIAGAWLLFCLIALPRLIATTVNAPPFVSLSGAGGGPARTDLSRHRQDVPGANVFPPSKSATVSHKLPPRFLREPLVFFSTAPPESLVLLPNIGPVLAARIFDARGGKRLFTAWDDLLRVKGIGKKTVANLKRLAAPE